MSMFDAGRGIGDLCEQLNSGGNVWSAIKEPCKAATTANITLSGRQTIDGVSLLDGARVLVKDQTASVENGIYLHNSNGLWPRALDWADKAEVVEGTVVHVQQGTTQAGYDFRVTTNGDITVGVTSVSIDVAYSSASSSFTQSGSGATSRSVQSEIRELHFNVKGFGAVGDGTTNDAAAIQAAIDAAETAGGTVYFPLGSYSLGTTSLTILGSGVVLKGAQPFFLDSTLYGSELKYSGTGYAVVFGQSGTTYYSNGFDNLQIRATGDATTSATAGGLKRINQHYFHSSRSRIKDFGGGVGTLAEPAGASQFGATSIFEGLLVHLCKVGIRATGSSAIIKDNHCIFLGGAILHTAQPAGTIGADLQQYSDNYIFYGTDVEGVETGWKIDGGNHFGFGSRSEDCTTHVSFTTNAVANHFVRHTNQGSGTAVADTSTAHSSTFQTAGSAAFRGKWLVQPLSDTTEVFQLLNAAGTTYADWTTSGTPKMEWVNGPDHVGYSDSFSTQKWKITGSTGSIDSASYIKSSSATDGIGYQTGAGGFVTQETNKGTTVVLSKVTGRITTHDANLAAGATASFTWTNTAIAGTDVIVYNLLTGTAGAYDINFAPGTGTCTVSITNRTGGGLAEAVTIQFCVLKGVVT